MIQSVRERIYQAIVDYCNASQRPVSRQRLAQITGYKAAAIDEHIKHLKDVEGRVYTDTPGYFQPVAQFGPDEDMSVTVLTNGMRKLEKGDKIVEFSPHEWAVLGSLASGSARELVERQDEKHLQGIIAQLKAQNREQHRGMVAMTAMIARMRRQGQPELFDTKETPTRKEAP